MIKRTEVQGYKDTVVEEYGGTGVRGYRGTKVRGYGGARVQRCGDTGNESTRYFDREVYIYICFCLY